MSKQLAHDLSDNKWRSEDISIGSEEENEVTFASLNLKENVLTGLTKNGFLRLSAIQLHAIPLGRCGLDLILQSKSGTGKTCVFVVIALELLEAFNSNAIQVLVICPTREIAVQTDQVMSALGSYLPNFKSCAVIGGTKLKDDINLLSKCQAVVGTPGRIKRLIELNILKTNSIRLLVLDECDKLLDINFKQQIDDIFECLPQNKQMIVVSATMTSDLADFLRQYMRTPVFVRLNADNPALIGVKQFFKITDCHHLNHINFDNKIDPLIQILKNISFSQCLVFSNYQTRARMLCDKLNALNWRTEYISAEKCQTERLEAISKLKKYKCRILVSTDLTARGIDVQNINLVISMDTPFDGQTYLHRIGRAGRFGTQGIAITIASSGREEEQLRKIIRDCKLKVEELKNPIPKDIWKMDDSNEDFNVIPNEDIQQKQSEELDDDLALNEEILNYNPFKRFDYKNDDNIDEASKRLLTYSQILNEYNLIKNSLKTSGVQNICRQNIDINCLDSTKGQNYMNLVNDLNQKCSLNEKENDFSEPNENTSKERQMPKNIQSFSCDSVKSDKQNKFSSICDDSQESNQSSETTHSSNNRSENNENILQNDLNLWANALFPPISSVNSPIGFNRWMGRNRFLWCRLLDPFQTTDKIHK